MDNPNNDTIGESRGNSLSSGDPVLNANQSNTTSTDPTSNQNTGESAPQQGTDIVNEQEQHKSVNMEEYVENSSQNRLGENEGSSVKEKGEDENATEDVPEINGDSDTGTAFPTMQSGAL